MLHAHKIFISCAKGLEYLLADELKPYGLLITAISPHGIYADASLEIIYNCCLWSRLANRVQLILFKGEVLDQATLYNLCHNFDWQKIFSVDKSLSIEFHGYSDTLRNSMFGAQVIKDAIVDYFRIHTQQRPMIDKLNPQILLHAHLKSNTLTMSLDLVGYSLHQRGYRLAQGIAPLKETLASAMLMRANWPNALHNLYDPFCGSGTIVIEAAMLAANIAPGLLRQDQAFAAWKGHNEIVWQQMRQQASQERKEITDILYGTDNDPKAITQAQANAQRAGVADIVQFAIQDINTLDLHRRTHATGLLITNPPYGERLQDATQLIPLYQQLGKIMHNCYQNWHAAILTANEVLAKAIGLRAHKSYAFYNGALPCRLYCINIDAEQTLRDVNYAPPRSESATMFANRLQKNANHYKKWAKKQQISCYRVYDADLPEYAFAIDIYADYAVLQEYTAPDSIPTHLSAQRRQAVLEIAPEVLNINKNNIIFKQRQAQKGMQQYQKFNATQKFLQVQEGRAWFKVNLYDYLDTGLFLDHRLLRLKFAQLATGTRFLNCFCYTATASVHAALAGAITTNVDLSATYLSWAQDNFCLNQLDINRHQFIQYDVLNWLQLTHDKFDVIFLDPPSFSNSKRMQGTLDIQRDHADLIEKTMRLLAPKGILYFSTNLRSFKLAASVTTQYASKDISAQTIDIDFKRNQRIHKCWRLMRL